MAYNIEEFNINNRTAYLSGVDLSLEANALTQQPASCKSVNDKFSDIINNISTDIGKEIDVFEFGGIIKEYGELVDNLIRIRTTPIYFNKEYEKIVYYYSTPSYIVPAKIDNDYVACAYLGYTFVSAIPNLSISNNIISFNNDGTFDNIRISFKKKDDTEITQDELDSSKMYYIKQRINDIEQSIVRFIGSSNVKRLSINSIALTSILFIDLINGTLTIYADNVNLQECIFSFNIDYNDGNGNILVLTKDYEFVMKTRNNDLLDTDYILLYHTNGVFAGPLSIFLSQYSLNELKEDFINNNLIFQLGTFDDNGNRVDYRYDRIVTTGLYRNISKVYVKSNDISINIALFSINGLYYKQGVWNSEYEINSDCYVRIAAKYNDDRKILDINLLKDLIGIEKSLLNDYTYNAINKIQNDLYTNIALVYGGVSKDTGSLISNNIRIRTSRIYIDTIGKHIYFVDCPSNFILASVVAYSDTTYVKELSDSEFTGNYFTFVNDGTFNNIIFSLKKTDESEITLEELNTIVIYNNNSVVNNKYNGLKYCAIGDSITYGYIPRNYEGYPGKLRSYAELTAYKLGMTFENYGISGSTVAYHSSRNPMSVRYTELPDDADVITVMGGTNDVRNSIELGTFSDRDNTTFYGALHVLLQGLYTKYIAGNITTGKKKKIVVLTPIKLLDPNKSSLANTIENNANVLYEWDAWIEAVKKVAEFYSFPVLDFYNLSGINPHLNRTIVGTETDYTGNYNPYITDGTHPTQEGAEMMSDILVSFLKTL